MADTDQIRRWYHRGVVLNHNDRGQPGYQPRCDHDQPRVGFPNSSGGVYNEPVHPFTVEAWQAYVAVMEHHGETMPSAGGVDQCRNIDGTNWPSLHAYLCAVDLPPNDRKSDAFIRSVEAIRTNSGAQVFKNLEGDRMHDQIDCSPVALASGIDWSTVIGQGEQEMTLKKGDKGNAVNFFQNALNTWRPSLGLVVGSTFDDKMVEAVKNYQGASDLPKTGEIDGITGVLLAEYRVDKADPPAGGGGIQPGSNVTITGIIK